MLTFKQERETKNTIRFQEEGDPPKIGTLYISKWALPKPYPASVQVTIVTEEGEEVV